ncbi:MAG TPA: hypothetical protein VMT30_07130 [Candidatus Saccharimonadia bacterium]|nr:hypothetical protein [Candidatus Saccharimonadia bacterium]
MTELPIQALPRDGYLAFSGMSCVTEFWKFAGTSLLNDIPTDSMHFPSMTDYAWGTLQAWPLSGGREVVDVGGEAEPDQNRRGRRLFFLTLPGSPAWIITLILTATPMWQPPGTLDLRLIRTRGVVEYADPGPHRRSLTALVYIGFGGFGACVELVGANGQTVHRQVFEPGDAVLFDDRRLRPACCRPIGSGASVIISKSPSASRAPIRCRTHAAPTSSRPTRCPEEHEAPRGFMAFRHRLTKPPEPCLNQSQTRESVFTIN